MKRHEYKVHGIKKLPNVCEVCYTPYKNVHKCQATRKRNYDNERNSACNICGKKYSRKVKLRQHIMNFHNTDTSEKIHICKHCGKSYGTPALLKAHIDPKKCSSSKECTRNICVKNMIDQSDLDQIGSNISKMDQNGSELIKLEFAYL